MAPKKASRSASTSRAQFSVSPTGEKFAIPAKRQYDAEFKRIEKKVKKAL